MRAGGGVCYGTTIYRSPARQAPTVTQFPVTGLTSVLLAMMPLGPFASLPTAVPPRRALVAGPLGDGGRALDVAHGSAPPGRRCQRGADSRLRCGPGRPIALRPCTMGFHTHRAGGPPVTEVASLLLVGAAADRTTDKKPSGVDRSPIPRAGWRTRAAGIAHSVAYPAPTDTANDARGAGKRDAHTRSPLDAGAWPNMAEITRLRL